MGKEEGKSEPSTWKGSKNKVKEKRTWGKIRLTKGKQINGNDGEQAREKVKREQNQERRK